MVDRDLGQPNACAMTTIKMKFPAEVNDYPADLKDRFMVAVRCYEDAVLREDQILARDEIIATIDEARRRRAN
jgi:hypothetical protein